MTLVKYHRHSAAFNESHARSTKFCKKKILYKISWKSDVEFSR
jgi:hypothetical protein